MRLCRLCSRLCHWSSGAWDSWRQILPVKTTVKSCVRKRCEKPCLGPPHLHSRAAFKLRHLSLVLTWAMLQPCLCLAMHPTDPDRDPLTSFPCFTSDHHCRLAWKPRLLPNLVTVTRYTLSHASIGGLRPYQWGYCLYLLCCHHWLPVCLPFSLPLLWLPDILFVCF